MPLLVGMIGLGILLGIAIVGYPLYKEQQWPELAAVVVLFLIGGSLGIVQTIYFEINIPLRNLVDLLPDAFDPLLEFMITR